jgi:hypothetical protein
MALQRVEPYMTTAECASVWDEWLEFYNQCHDAAQQQPAQAKQIWASYIKAYHACHDGYLLTDRAALARLEQEERDAPTCPFEDGSEPANIWSQLQYAQLIRDDKSIRELSRQLTSLSMRSTPTPRARRPQRDEGD